VAFVGFAVLVAASITPPERNVFDASLPNPMGGLARTAPGEVSGEVELAGLEIDRRRGRDGRRRPRRHLRAGLGGHQPDRREVAFTAGQPQVLEGCCPGPIYVDGELTQVDQRFAVPPGGSVLLQFPLQMHRGWTARTTSPSRCSPTASRPRCT
jgi:hypothetical protein